MAKSNSKQFKCSACGSITLKWSGCCLDCKEWNTLESIEKSGKGSTQHHESITLSTLDDVTSELSHERYQSGISEWDRVMGDGGIMPGSFLVITGDPGIGKSTLLLQVAAALSKQRTVMYVSTEESLAQLKQRATRIGLDATGSLLFSDATDLTAIIESARQTKPALLIIDSIQNSILPEEERSIVPGSVNHLKQAGFLLMHLAKKETITVIVTGHITKEGTMAGPKVLEHMVDGVFYLQGEDRWHLRMLRSVKNRFGTIDEIGFFEMESAGLSAVNNINEHFIRHMTHATGAAVTCNLEGTRPLLLDVQALCVPTKFSMPQRIVTGIEAKRVALIAAILEKYLHISLSSVDIFFKVGGGCTIKESAGDLAIALALLSSFFEHPLPEKSYAFGEISLTGHVKPITTGDARIKEAESFGLTTGFIAVDQQVKEKHSTLNRIKSVYELLAFFPLK